MWHVLIPIVCSLIRFSSAHGGAANYTVGDTWYPGYDPYGNITDEDTAPWEIQRKWITNMPIFEADNVSLACNFPGTPAHTYIPMNAGDNITAVYYYWVHTVGPMVAWMTDCKGDCRNFDTTNADWFKIGEKGLLYGTILEGMWFQHQFGTWDGSPSLWSENVPKNLKPGNYLIRHEIIALHVANKPQWYPECVHVQVTGNGTKYPSQDYMAKIPGVYSMNDPNININVYDPVIGNQTNYTIPGPPVWTG